ncbi:hypothetical protein GCM10009623_16460 [Nocardioides aestuarii]|uniref:DUF6281 family protein n=1 Tax=Nocardioides aestuarii TaxID=252231 RepID=A0ABW4TJF8_9ACTN
MKVLGVLLAVLVLAGCRVGGESEASCVLVVDYDGARYESAPRGTPDREPELTGRTATGVLPGCNDTGADEDPPGEEVEVQEIEGVPMSVAVWVAGDLAVRQGEDLPASADAWWGRPACDQREPTTLTGTWLGVRTEKEPRFDGDLRTPLTLTLRVEPGHDNPPALERWTLRVVDDGGAEPALDQEDAERALWSTRALLAVTVTCDGPRYRATGYDLVS